LGLGDLEVKSRDIRIPYSDEQGHELVQLKTEGELCALLLLKGLLRELKEQRLAAQLKK
jgi:hypothetical protein